MLEILGILALIPYAIIGMWLIVLIVALIISHFKF
jgi:hypothetical protein